MIRKSHNITKQNPFSAGLCADSRDQGRVRKRLLRSSKSIMAQISESAKISKTVSFRISVEKHFFTTVEKDNFLNYLGM